MPLNWINVEEFSFNSFLFFERFQIRLILTSLEQEPPERPNLPPPPDAPDFSDFMNKRKTSLGIALEYNPAVKWYFIHKCPECAETVEKLAADVPKGLSAETVRRAEVFAMGVTEDFVTYTKPEIMDESSDYIYAWDSERLFELADFTDKVVLDVGSGSGRLAFAASLKTREVYASEPVDSLREYLRDKIAREGIKNMRVSDGMAHCLPYPDNTFDIVMSGHVVGDDVENETAELTRVVKSGGWLLDCRGESAVDDDLYSDLVEAGWEPLGYPSTLGGYVYRYRKQVIK